MLMPTLNLVTELTIDDLLAVVAGLNDDELAEFEIRFEQLWLSRTSTLDKEAAQIANAHRLSPRQQVRLRALLDKNREEGLGAREENEFHQQVLSFENRLSEIFLC
jgi:hypothetical protein